MKPIFRLALLIPFLTALFFLVWSPMAIWEWWHFGPSQKILRATHWLCPFSGPREYFVFIRRAWKANTRAAGTVPAVGTGTHEPMVRPEDRHAAS